MTTNSLPAESLRAWGSEEGEEQAIYDVMVLQGAVFKCRADMSVLQAMERSGTKSIQVGCRGGGCGFCRVRVWAGEYRTGPMSRAQVSESEERQGFALACQLYPLSDLRLEPLGPKPSGPA